MTLGQLFKAMNPKVVVRENGTCVWLFFEDEINHYTIATKWWEQEIPDNAIATSRGIKQKEGEAG